MNNDFRQNGKLRVRYCSAEERGRLLNTVASIGIPIGELGRGKYSPKGTHLYEIDIKEKTIEYIGEPFVGAAMCSSGIRFYSVDEFCRLAELEFKIMPRFLVFHVPHEGGKFPVKLLASTCIPREEFEKYHEKMRDTGVSRLIPDPYRNQSATEQFDISRLLCDVERLLSPEEPMEKYGMGYCYERAYDGTVIKNVSDKLRERTRLYYYEHMQKMLHLCSSHPAVLLFDMHSYSDDIVPGDFLEPGRETPDVGIGTDERFTSLSLSIIAKARFEEAGLTVAENYPYSGCYIPYPGMAEEGKCLSIMLEFNKRVYLDGDGKVDEEKAAVIRDVIKRIIVDCISLGSVEDTLNRKMYSDDGLLAYEGVSKDGRPLGEGKAYYADGTVYQEGLFDGKGLLYGREYYQNGQLRFEGIYKHKKGYGPNYPVYGSFYSEDGVLQYSGAFKVTFGGCQAYPSIKFPEKFGRILQDGIPKLYGLKSQVIWKTLNSSVLLDQEESKE